MHHSFDTHDIVKRFIGSGLKENQAEAIVKAIAEGRDYDLGNLATKTDLIPLTTKAELLAIKAELKAQMAQLATKDELFAVKAELKVDIAQLATKDELMQVRSDMVQIKADLSIQIERTISAIEISKSETLKWIIGIAIASIGTITGLIAMLLKYFLQ